MPGAHVALTWMLSQIPAPSPGLDSRIRANAAKSSLTSTAIARELGVDPHPWEREERYALDVETDALVAHSYGVSPREYEVVLDTFDVLARRQIETYGRYKFKEDCLGTYRRTG